MRGEGGGVAGSQPMSTAVHRSPNKLWRSNSIFNLWPHGTTAKNSGPLLLHSLYAPCYLFLIPKFMSRKVQRIQWGDLLTDNVEHFWQHQLQLLPEQRTGGHLGRPPLYYHWYSLSLLKECTYLILVSLNYVFAGFPVHKYGIANRQFILLRYVR